VPVVIILCRPVVAGVVVAPDCPDVDGVVVVDCPVVVDGVVVVPDCPEVVAVVLVDDVVGAAIPKIVAVTA
jgi:hypothetical protein